MAVPFSWEQFLYNVGVSSKNGEGPIHWFSLAGIMSERVNGFTDFGGTMKVFKGMIPYIAGIAAVFYLLPLCMGNTVGAIMVLLFAMPVLCLAISFLYGRRHGFHWIYPLAVCLCFLPSIWIFYNESALVYVAVYGGLALLGSFLGGLR